MKTIILLLSLLVMQWCLIFGQDQKKYTKVELKEVPELTGFKWSIQISVGGMLGGPGTELKKALINARYDIDFKSFFGVTSYPSSSHQNEYSVGISRWVNKYFTIGLNVNTSTVGADGFNGYKRLSLNYVTTSYSPLVKFTPVEFFFLGVGPVFSLIKQNEIIENNNLNKLGVAFYSSVRINKNTSRMFGFIDLNYFLQGSEQVGPYIDDSPLHLDFPASKINFSYGYVGVGLGLRL